MSDINVPLLHKALEHIEAHPEEHNQEVWAERSSCGTAYCLAGTVVVMAGHQIQWLVPEQISTTKEGSDSHGHKRQEQQGHKRRTVG